VNEHALEVDDAFFEVLSVFSQAAEAVNAPWLVVGATARIMLLEKVYGLPQGLATRDIDFGVQVGSWDHYRELCEAITAKDVLETERTPTKRFRSKQAMVFDLVPYGGVENDQKQVHWPPHQDEVMTVRGFSGAGESSTDRSCRQSGSSVRIETVCLAGTACAASGQGCQGYRLLYQ
jgi:predicted nucleotidyltransferase